MARYRLTATASSTRKATQDMDWTEDDFIRFQRGDFDQVREASQVANELVNIDFWVEKIEDNEEG